MSNVPRDDQFFRSLKTTGELVAFSHTIFALPFALAMAIDIARTRPVSLQQYGILILCIASARTAAMGWNRIADAKIDAMNPRTAERPIPRGDYSMGAAWLLTVSSSSAFLIFSALLGYHCAVIAPAVLLLLFTYSFCKRFTALSHGVLGLCLAAAPGGVWYALVGTFDWYPVPLMVAVTLWVAGFDIIYSCQDAEFDKSMRLHSVPARFGIRRAFWLARMLHVFACLALVFFGYLSGSGAVYFVGAAFFSAFVFAQHFQVGPRNLARIDRVFFTRNGFASVSFFVFTLANALVETWS